MYRKILIGFAPLLAVAAFAVMPAMASALTRAYGTCVKGAPHTANCPAGYKFKAFAGGEEVKVKGHIVSTDFILENNAKTADIECTSLSITGFVVNIGGIGKSKFTLTFDDCVGTGELAVCEEINSPTREITGEVTDEVNAAGNVIVKIAKGFNVKCLIGGKEEEFGDVTGEVTGTPNGTKLEFNEATGLTFLGQGSNITGIDEIETEGGMPILIN